jgi:hypothetical protein
MRTTVTLDPDVERLIRSTMRERGISFKEALNSAARMGLLGNQPRRKQRFVQKSFSMGASQDSRWDNALANAEVMGRRSTQPEAVTYLRS